MRSWKFFGFRSSHLRATNLSSHMGSLPKLIVWLVLQYVSAHLEGDVIKFPAVAQRRSAGINQSGGRSGDSGQTFPRPPAVSPAARRTFGAPGAHFRFYCLFPGHYYLFSHEWDKHFSLQHFFSRGVSRKGDRSSAARREHHCVKRA